MLELVIAVSLATAVSFLCSITEAAFYSFPMSRIERLRREGRRSGRILAELRRDVERPITAILALNTAANTAGAAVAGAAAARVFGEAYLAPFTIGFTIILLIFGELVPKTAGVAYARQLTPRLARPLKWLVTFCLPVIWIFGGVVHLIRRRKRDPDADEDDIRALVSLTRRQGIIKPYEESAIKNILALDSKRVAEVMTPRTVVFSLPASMTVAEALAGKHGWPHSRIPIYEGEDMEDVVGIVHRRQIFESAAADRMGLTLGELMRPVHFVLDSLTLDKLLRSFLESRVHLSVVLDEYGGIAGVVSLEDVLEELLGTEIVDESDEVVDMRELARRRRNELAPSGRDGTGGQRGD